MSHDERSFFAGRQQGQRACEKEMEVMAALLDARTAEVAELIEKVGRLQELLRQDRNVMLAEQDRLRGEIERLRKETWEQSGLVSELEHRGREIERLKAQACAQALLVSDNDRLCREVERLQGEMVRGNEIVAELQEESSYTQALERQLLEARAENERLKAAHRDIIGKAEVIAREKVDLPECKSAIYAWAGAAAISRAVLALLLIV